MKTKMMMKTTSFVVSTLLVLLMAGDSSFTVVNAQPMTTCAIQSKCVTFNYTKIPDNVGGCGTCSYRVCLSLTTGSGNDCKSAGSTWSHTCRKTSSNSTHIGSTCSVPTGFTANTLGIETPNPVVGTHSECQIVAAGSTAQFLLKDGNGCGTTTLSANLADSSRLSCFPRGQNITSCTGNGAGVECIWQVILPSVAVCAGRPVGSGLRTLGSGGSNTSFASGMWYPTLGLTAPVAAPVPVPVAPVPVPVPVAPPVDMTTCNQATANAAAEETRGNAQSTNAKALLTTPDFAAIACPILRGTIQDAANSVQNCLPAIVTAKNNVQTAFGQKNCPAAVSAAAQAKTAADQCVASYTSVKNAYDNAVLAVCNQAKTDASSYVAKAKTDSDAALQVSSGSSCSILDTTARNAVNTAAGAAKVAFDAATAAQQNVNSLADSLKCAEAQAAVATVLTQANTAGTALANTRSTADASISAICTAADASAVADSNKAKADSTSALAIVSGADCQILDSTAKAGVTAVANNAKGFADSAVAALARVKDAVSKKDCGAARTAAADVTVNANNCAKALVDTRGAADSAITNVCTTASSTSAANLARATDASSKVDAMLADDLKSLSNDEKKPITDIAKKIKDYVQAAETAHGKILASVTGKKCGDAQKDVSGIIKIADDATTSFNDAKTQANIALTAKSASKAAFDAICTQAGIDSLNDFNRADQDNKSAQAVSSGSSTAILDAAAKSTLDGVAATAKTAFDATLAAHQKVLDAVAKNDCNTAKTLALDTKTKATACNQALINTRSSADAAIKAVCNAATSTAGADFSRSVADLNSAKAISTSQDYAILDDAAKSSVVAALSSVQRFADATAAAKLQVDNLVKDGKCGDARTAAVAAKNNADNTKKAFDDTKKVADDAIASVCTAASTMDDVQLQKANDANAIATSIVSVDGKNLKGNDKKDLEDRAALVKAEAAKAATAHGKVQTALASPKNCGAARAAVAELTVIADKTKELQTQLRSFADQLLNKQAAADSAACSKATTDSSTDFNTAQQDLTNALAVSKGSDCKDLDDDSKKKIDAVAGNAASLGDTLKAAKKKVDDLVKDKNCDGAVTAAADLKVLAISCKDAFDKTKATATTLITAVCTAAMTDATSSLDRAKQDLKNALAVTSGSSTSILDASQKQAIDDVAQTAQRFHDAVLAAQKKVQDAVAGQKCFDARQLALDAKVNADSCKDAFDKTKSKATSSITQICDFASASALSDNNRAQQLLKDALAIPAGSDTSILDPSAKNSLSTIANTAKPFADKVAAANQQVKDAIARNDCGAARAAAADARTNADSCKDAVDITRRAADKEILQVCSKAVADADVELKKATDAAKSASVILTVDCDKLANDEKMKIEKLKNDVETAVKEASAGNQKIKDAMDKMDCGGARSKLPDVRASADKAVNSLAATRAAADVAIAQKAAADFAVCTQASADVLDSYNRAQQDLKSALAVSSGAGCSILDPSTKASIDAVAANAKGFADSVNVTMTRVKDLVSRKECEAAKSSAASAKGFADSCKVAFDNTRNAATDAIMKICTAASASVSIDLKRSQDDLATALGLSKGNDYKILDSTTLLSINGVASSAQAFADAVAAAEKRVKEAVAKNDCGAARAGAADAKNNADLTKGALDKAKQTADDFVVKVCTTAAATADSDLKRANDAATAAAAIAAVDCKDLKGDDKKKIDDLAASAAKAAKEAADAVDRLRSALGKKDCGGARSEAANAKLSADKASKAQADARTAADLAISKKAADDFAVCITAVSNATDYATKATAAADTASNIVKIDCDSLDDVVKKAVDQVAASVRDFAAKADQARKDAEKAKDKKDCATAVSFAQDAKSFADLAKKALDDTKGASTSALTARDAICSAAYDAAVIALTAAKQDAARAAGIVGVDCASLDPAAKSSVNLIALNAKNLADKADEAMSRVMESAGKKKCNDAKVASDDAKNFANLAKQAADSTKQSCDTALAAKAAADKRAADDARAKLIADGIKACMAKITYSSDLIADYSDKAISVGADCSDATTIALANKVNDLAIGSDDILKRASDASATGMVTDCNLAAGDLSTLASNMLKALNDATKSCEDNKAAAIAAAKAASAWYDPIGNCGALVRFDLDFNSLPAGSYVKYQFLADYNVTVKASGGYTPDSAARLFDSAAPTSGNEDLGSPNVECGLGGSGIGAGGRPTSQFANCEPLKNVLIIQDGKDQYSPIDSSTGGSLVFNFYPAMDVESIGLLSIKEGGPLPVVKVKLAEAADIKAFTTVATGENGLLALKIKQKGVEWLRVDYGGPGAVAYLRYQRCPGHPTTGTVEPPAIILASNVTTATATTTGRTGDSRSGSKPVLACMQDMYSMQKLPGNLICGKNMVYLDKVSTGNRTTCTAGDTITVDLKGTIRLKTGPYDLAWYIATDGGEALRGKCVISTLDQTNMYNVVASPGSTKSVGDVRWDSDALPNGLDRNDACGDVFFTDGSIGSIDISSLLTQQTIKCVDKNDDGNLDFGICFSYRTASTDSKCDPLSPVPSGSDTCYCARYDVPQISVVKNPTSNRVCVYP